MNIRLHIDRLILDGLDLAYADRGRLAAAVEAELSRLISEGGLAADLSSGAALDALSGASILAPAGLSVDQMGARIAQGVYGGLGTGERSE